MILNLVFQVIKDILKVLCSENSYLCLVQVKPQIKASILLGLFSLMLLHQMIPHLHHEHKEEHDHGVAEQAHSHEHQHEKEPEGPKDLFSILLAMHSHGGSSTEVPVVKETVQHIILKKVKAETSSPQVYLPKNAFPEGTVAECIRDYQPPPKYLDAYLSFLSLRGPPQLALSTSQASV